jgi:hypothetical protein
MAAHSSQFVSALQAAEKAWYGTPMFARVRAAKGEELQGIVTTGTPAQWAAYLTDVAGPAFASYAVTAGMDASKAERLGRLVMEMAWAELPPPADGTADTGGLARLQQLCETLQRWIDTGEATPAGDLTKTGALIPCAEQRLAIVAPLASALGVCMVMLKAMVSGYPVGVPA